MQTVETYQRQSPVWMACNYRASYGTAFARASSSVGGANLCLDVGLHFRKRLEGVEEAYRDFEKSDRDGKTCPEARQVVQCHP